MAYVLLFLTIFFAFTAGLWAGTTPDNSPHPRMDIAIFWLFISLTTLCAFASQLH